MRDLSELEIPKRWEYLRRYYREARAFHGAREEVVTDAEVRGAVAGLKDRPKPLYRKVVPIEDWRFTLDAEDGGLRAGYFTCAHDESGWDGVRLPHSFSEVPQDPVLFGRTDYMFYARRDNNPVADIWKGDMTAWYKARVDLEPIDGGRGKYFYLHTGIDHPVAYLSVGSANLVSDVWVNESPVSFEHTGPFPYKVEVTEALCSGVSASPVVAVRVKNTVSNMPHLFANGFQHCYFGDRFFGGEARYDWPDRADGGLAGDVTLTVLNKHHIEDAFIRTRSIGKGSASVELTVTTRNQFSSRAYGKVGISVTEWVDGPGEGGPAEAALYDVSSRPMDDTAHTFTVNVRDPKLWTPDEPNMYLAHIVLYGEGGEPIDDVYEPFGVRTFAMNGSSFYLNGRRTVLQGTHDIANYHGESLIWLSDAMIAKDILLHKRMGANCSRWPSDSRMHHRRIAECCDQLGFMLTWAGYFEVWNIHPNAEMFATRDVKAMVRDLRNHPSIVIWEMGDETLQCDNHFRRMRFFDLMHDLVLESDPTRPIVPSGYYSGMVTGFSGFDPDAGGDPDVRAIRVASEYPLYDKPNVAWDVHMGNVANLNALTDLMNGKKPLIFTEFGGCNALPDPSLTSAEYGGFHWNKTPFWNVEPAKSDIGIFGRMIGPDDWRETQAMSAAKLGFLIGALRQHPDAVAAYQFVMLIDYWTIYVGATDIHGNAKLAFHIAKSHFEPVFITALQGNAIVGAEAARDVTVNNQGPDIAGATLRVTVRGDGGAAAVEAVFKGVDAEGGVALTKVASLDISSLREGIYAFEYVMTDGEGRPLGRMFEMAYVEAADRGPAIAADGGGGSPQTD